MVTRLQKKQSPEDSAREEPRGPVRLTEDLMYLVNKEIAEKDKKDRNDKLKRAQSYLTGPFKEVQYRNLNIRLSETGKGVETKLKSVMINNYMVNSSLQPPEQKVP